MGTFDRPLHEGLGTLIRGRRSDLGISQETLANAVGLSRTSITNIEKGRQKLSVQTLYALAKVLQTSPRALLPEAQPRAADLANASLPEGLAKPEKEWIQSVLDPTKGRGEKV